MAQAAGVRHKEEGGQQPEREAQERMGEGTAALCWEQGKRAHWNPGVMVVLQRTKRRRVVKNRGPGQGSSRRCREWRGQEERSSHNSKRAPRVGLCPVSFKAGCVTLMCHVTTLCHVTTTHHGTHPRFLLLRTAVSARYKAL